MAPILSWPFRLGVDGAIVTVDQDDPQADAEQVAVLLLTRPGERDLVPGFGVPDPTFAALRPAEVNGAAAIFGPPVKITEARIVSDDGATVTAELVFDQVADDGPASRYGPEASGAVSDLDIGLLDGPLQ